MQDMSFKFVKMIAQRARPTRSERIMSWRRMRKCRREGEG